MSCRIDEELHGAAVSALDVSELDVSALGVPAVNMFGFMSSHNAVDIVIFLDCISIQPSSIELFESRWMGGSRSSTGRSEVNE